MGGQEFKKSTLKNKIYYIQLMLYVVIATSTLILIIYKYNINMVIK